MAERREGADGVSVDMLFLPIAVLFVLFPILADLLEWLVKGFFRLPLMFGGVL